MSLSSLLFDMGTIWFTFGIALIATSISRDSDMNIGIAFLIALGALGMFLGVLVSIREDNKREQREKTRDKLLEDLVNEVKGYRNDIKMTKLKGGKVDG